MLFDRVRVRCQVRCLVSEIECPKFKIRPTFQIFDHLCKIRGGVGELSKLERSSIIIAEDGSMRFPISFSVSFEVIIRQRRLVSKIEAKFTS